MDGLGTLDPVRSNQCRGAWFKHEIDCGGPASATKSLGLAEDWLVKVIGGVGNYGEIFERNLGENTPLDLRRGINALWTQGGLLYAPPMQ
jgi:hypothetical protein